MCIVYVSVIELRCIKSFNTYCFIYLIFGGDLGLVMSYCFTVIKIFNMSYFDYLC